MKNSRIELQNFLPNLLSIGLPCFGFYNNKILASPLAPHEHGSCYEICYLQSGMQPYYLHPRTADPPRLYRLYGGDVFIIHPHEVHSTGTFGQLRGQLFWLQIDPEHPSLLGHAPKEIQLLHHALGNMPQRIFRLSAPAAKYLTTAFEYLQNSTDDLSLFRANELLTLFLLDVSEQSRMQPEGSSSRISTKSMEAILFIQNHLLYEDLNVDTVADYLHYSRSYMMREFKAEIGLPIHEYILRSKIDMACDLLASHSITETALLLHFSSSQHFSQIFKAYTGMTPKYFVLHLQNEIE